MDAAGWDARYAASEQVWSTGPNQFVERELADLTPGEAVDLACGEGRNALWLARRGWQVTAVDFSAVAVQRGQRLAAEAGVDLTWRVDDATSAALPEADLVVVAYLQLPTAQRGAALRNGFDALRPGGTLLVVAHDSTNLAEGTGGPQDPAVLYTADDVLADLDGRPVQVVRAERVARTVGADDGHGGRAEATAWDALVVVRRT